MRPFERVELSPGAARSSLRVRGRCHRSDSCRLSRGRDRFHERTSGNVEHSVSRLWRTQARRAGRYGADETRRHRHGVGRTPRDTTPTGFRTVSLTTRTTVHRRRSITRCAIEGQVHRLRVGRPVVRPAVSEGPRRCRSLRGDAAGTTVIGSERAFDAEGARRREPGARGTGSVPASPHHPPRTPSSPTVIHRAVDGPTADRTAPASAADPIRTRSRRPPTGR